MGLGAAPGESLARRGRPPGGGRRGRRQRRRLGPAQRAHVAELLAQDAARWAVLESELARAERGEVTPDRGRHPGRRRCSARWAVREAAAAAARGLSVGELVRRPAQVHVTVDSLGALLNADATEPAALLSGGGFDFAFVVVAVLPLLLLAVTYDVVSAERERGTWALIRAQPVNPSHLVLAKLAVRAGMVVGTALSATVPGLG